MLGLGGVFGRDRDDDAGLRLVEEGDIGAGAGDFDLGSEGSAQAGLGEVDGEAAFGAVVGAFDEALTARR